MRARQRCVIIGRCGVTSCLKYRRRARPALVPQEPPPPPADGGAPRQKLALGKVVGKPLALGKAKGKTLAFGRKGKSKAASKPAVSLSLRCCITAAAAALLLLLLLKE